MVSTRLVSTGGTSRSLRTTVPQWVVEHFSLTPGDAVNWALKVENGEVSLVVTPKRIDLRDDATERTGFFGKCQ